MPRWNKTWKRDNKALGNVCTRFAKHYRWDYGSNSPWHWFRPVSSPIDLTDSELYRVLPESMAAIATRVVAFHILWVCFLRLKSLPVLPNLTDFYHPVGQSNLSLPCRIAFTLYFHLTHFSGLWTKHFSASFLFADAKTFQICLQWFHFSNVDLLDRLSEHQTPSSLFSCFIKQISTLTSRSLLLKWIG